MEGHLRFYSITVDCGFGTCSLFGSEQRLWEKGYFGKVGREDSEGMKKRDPDPASVVVDRLWSSHSLCLELTQCPFSIKA